MRCEKLEKNNPSVQKKMAVTTSIKVEIDHFSHAHAAQKKSEALQGDRGEDEQQQKYNRRTEFSKYEARAESRDVFSRSMVLCSRSEEIAPAVRAGPINPSINNSSRTTVLKMTLPTVCRKLGSLFEKLPSTVSKR